MDPVSTPVAFITARHRLNLAGFNGVCQVSRFDPAQYSDELFAYYNVAFPLDLHSANSKRKAEFLAGRVSANDAFLSLGLLPQPVGIGPHRNPLWPSSVIGSISHHKHSGYCMLMRRPVSRSLRTSLGVDVESVIADGQCQLLAPTLASTLETELLLNHYGRFDHAVTLAFSAKEALFKALYPAVGRYFDFLDVRISAINTAAALLELKLVKDLSPDFLRGDAFTVYYQLDDNKVLSWVLSE